VRIGEAGVGHVATRLVQCANKKRNARITSLLSQPYDCTMGRSVGGAKSNVSVPYSVNAVCPPLAPTMPINRPCHEMR